LSFYQSGDARLFFHTFGNGPDLVLLHPTPVHHGFWLPVALALGDRYRVTLPDLRGHGQSEAGHGVISVERLGEDLERLLDAAQIGTAHFVGCSIGSYALFELWRRIPKQILALAFCCGKPQPDTEANRTTRAGNIEKIKAEGTGQFFEGLLATLVGPTSRVRHPERLTELRAMMDFMTPEAAIAVQQGLGQRPDSVPTLATIDVPVFTLAGGEDTSSTPAEMAVFPNVAPDRCRVLPDAGHYAPYEQPELVGSLLGKFLGDLDKPVARG
jgi:3-oxoadipate enol-lactonase